MKLLVNIYVIIFAMIGCTNLIKAADDEKKSKSGAFYSDKANSDETKNWKSDINEAKAQESLKAAKQYELGNNYRNAAKKYMEVQLFSNKKSAKAEAVVKAAECYEKAGLFYEQFKCIERLIRSYPHRIDFSALVDKEFAIADKFHAGHRDPEFYSLRWVPWLTSSDKSPEIYEKAVANAPFSKYSAQALLRLAKQKTAAEQFEDALTFFRKIIKDHPTSKSAEYAYLNMIMLLSSLAKHGDGDGRLTYETIDLSNDYIEKYPKSKELEWVKKKLIITQNNAAKRLYNIAKYYKRYNREDAAKDYLEEILQRYNTTQTVIKAEDMLSSIDPNFELSELPPKVKSPYIPYQKHEMLTSSRKVLIVPENSGNKWLLPVRDLGLGDKENLSDNNNKIGKNLALSNQIKRELLKDEYKDSEAISKKNKKTNTAK